MLKSIRSRDVMRSESFETLQALFLGLEGRDRRISILCHLAKPYHQLAVLLFEFSVCRVRRLALRLQLLDAVSRLAHRRGCELDSFENTGDIGSYGERVRRVGCGRGRIALCAAKVAIQVLEQFAVDAFQVSDPLILAQPCADDMTIKHVR